LYATEILRQEHKVIERILPVLEEAARRVEHGRSLDADIFPEIIDFMRVFADQCHHAKEEAQLFPVLKESGIDTDGGLVGALVEEHREARALVGKLAGHAAKIDEVESAAEVAAITRVYIRLLKMHIEKEDVTLMPLVDRTLKPEQQMSLAVIFEDVEDEEPCKGSYDRYRELVSELEERLEIA
jgi:hemerythrin-like domain-containing protein